MSQALVVCYSRYGHAQRYAQWIAEDLSADLIAPRQLAGQDLSPYGTVIFGGGLYAGGLPGLTDLTRRATDLTGKRLVLFTCGLADPEDRENIDHIRQTLRKTLTPELEAAIAFFHLRGGIDYKGLGFVDRLLMGMMARMLRKKDPDQRSEMERDILDTYGQPVDFIDRATIKPLVAFCQE